ncbi:MAG TPA: hypothetical protein VNX00_04790, partial [Herbaspirillum sp.]|nr:hypothetical protein [Herbaspirillum sp.]
LAEDDLPLVPPQAWQDTRVLLPGGCAIEEWQDSLSRRRVMAVGGCIALAQALAGLPVAVLYCGAD